MELKIGICDCTTRYHGKLGGQQIIIESFAGVPLDSPIAVTLQEFRIPEADDRLEALQSSQCHVFLDVEEDETSLRMVWFDEGGVNHLAGRGTKYWIRKSPPPPSIVLKGLGRLIEGLSREQFEPWLEYKSIPTLTMPK